MEQANLKLEYRCTEAEKKEARALFLNQPEKRVLKWWTRSLDLLVTVGFVGVLVIAIITRKLPKDLLVAIGIAIIVVVVMALLRRRRLAEREPERARVSVSRQELVISANYDEAVVTKAWASFSRCLESPNLFVLVDQAGHVFHVIPKRAFPDETAQDWFRDCANQAPGLLPGTAVESASKPTPTVAKANLALILRYKFADYLNKNLTSWRMRGMVLGVIVLIAGICISQAFIPSPDAVNSPAKVFLIMSSMIVPMLAVLILIVSTFHWLAERKYRNAKQILVDETGMALRDADTNASLPWNTYNNYLENRRAFFVWNRRTATWLMIPNHGCQKSEDLARFRALLESHLVKSRWFYF